MSSLTSRQRNAQLSSFFKSHSDSLKAARRLVNAGQLARVAAPTLIATRGLRGYAADRAPPVDFALVFKALRGGLPRYVALEEGEHASSVEDRLLSHHGSYLHYLNNRLPLEERFHSFRRRLRSDLVGLGRKVAPRCLGVSAERAWYPEFNEVIACFKVLGPCASFQRISLKVPPVRDKLIDVIALLDRHKRAIPIEKALRSQGHDGLIDTIANDALNALGLSLKEVVEQLELYGEAIFRLPPHRCKITLYWHDFSIAASIEHFDGWTLRGNVLRYPEAIPSEAVLVTLVNKPLSQFRELPPLRKDLIIEDADNSNGILKVTLQCEQRGFSR